MTPRFDVYAILDPSALPVPSAWEDAARGVLAAGVGVVQLRDKHSSAAELVRRARRLTAMCHAHDATCVVNDRLDVALAAGAHGVHLGPEDISIGDARRVAPGLLIGGSAGTPERAVLLVDQGADYLGVGALYDASASKPNASMPRGPDVVRD
ncbi:MAG: thiamine phosphate synthase, partial [Myxococcota bacterium]